MSGTYSVVMGDRGRLVVPAEFARTHARRGRILPDVHRNFPMVSCWLPGIGPAKWSANRSRAMTWLPSCWLIGGVRLPPRTTRDDPRLIGCTADTAWGSSEVIRQVR